MFLIILVVISAIIISIHPKRYNFVDKNNVTDKNVK